MKTRVVHQTCLVLIACLITFGLSGISYAQKFLGHRVLYRRGADGCGRDFVGTGQIAAFSPMTYI